MKRFLFLLLLIPTLFLGQDRTGFRTVSGGIKIVDDTTSVDKTLGKVYFYSGDSTIYQGMGLYLEPIPTSTVMLAAIADSNKWTDGTTVNAIKPRDAKTVEADSAHIGTLHVSGNSELDGNLVLATTVSESLTIAAGGIRNEGSLRQKGVAQFGATATPTMIEADGDVGIGTTAPLADLSIVNGGGIQSGTHVVNSTINKNRTTWAQASDSASALLQVLGTGQPMLRMRALDGDSLSIWEDGSSVSMYAKNPILLAPSGSVMLRVSPEALGSSYIYGNFSGSPTDTRSLGIVTSKWKELWGSDNLYWGGKGQTATVTVGQQAVMTEVTDSTMVLEVVNGEPIITLLDGAGNQGLYATGDQVGIGTTAPGAKMEINGSKLADSLLIVRNDVIGRDSIFVVLPTGAISTTAATIGASNFTISAVDTVFTTGYVPRWVKFTSGGKSWYSPVYADTTGKW